jgi:tripartite ATP-independent transporter DctP family solute receptor
MKGSFNVLGVSMAICLLIGGFFGLSHAISAEITLRYAGDLVIGHHLTRGQEFFAKRVDEISKGRVKVEVYPAGQLFSAKDFPKVVPAGAVDMALSIMPQWSGLVPVAQITDLALFFEDSSHVWRTLDSQAGEIIAKEMEKVGVKHISWMQDTKGGFATKFSLKTMDDFKGKRIRVPTEQGAYTVKALGGAPAFMGGGEVYMALQRGTVDGAISSVASFCDRKYYEVTKYITEPDFMFAVYGCLMNLKKWNDLPADVQKILLTAGKETQEWGRGEIQKVEGEALDELKKHGMGIYSLPKKEKELWRNVCKPVYDLVIKKAGDLGPKVFELAEKAR